MFILFNKLSLIVLIIVAVGIGLCGCSEKQEHRPPTTTVTVDSLQPDQITSEAHVFLYSGNHKTTDLRADEIIQFTRLDSMMASNLDIIFFDSTGKQVSTLTAQSGYIREKDNFLSVTGNVIVIGEDSIQLMTEYLEWDATNELVSTDSFVTVIRDEDTLRSYGLITDPALRDITFKRRVSGRKALTDEDKGQDDDR